MPMLGTMHCWKTYEVVEDEENDNDQAVLDYLGMIGVKVKEDKRRVHLRMSDDTIQIFHRRNLKRA